MLHPTPPSVFSRSTPWWPYREKCYILNGAFFMSALYVRLSVEVGLRISFALVIKDPRIVQYKNSLRHRRSGASVRDEQRSRKKHGLRCRRRNGQDRRHKRKRYWGMWKRDGFSLECGSSGCKHHSSKRSLTYQSHFPHRKTLDICDSYIQGDLTRLRSSIKLQDGESSKERIYARQNVMQSPWEGGLRI